MVRHVMYAGDELHLNVGTVKVTQREGRGTGGVGRVQQGS